MSYLFDSSALCSLLVAAAVCILIGKRLTASHPSLRRVGGLIGGAAFLASIAWACNHGARPAEWGAVAVHAAALAGIVLGISWITLAVVRGFLWDVIGSLFSGSGFSRMQRSVSTRAAPQQERAQLPTDQETELSVTQRLETEASAQAAVIAQRRREDARAAADILFALHHHDIADALPRTMFDEFVAKYMRDDRDPDYVEQRSAQIQEVIRRLAEKGHPALPRTLQDIHRWYHEHKQAIEASALDEVARKIQLIHLEHRYDELMKKAIQGD